MITPLKKFQLQQRRAKVSKMYRMGRPQHEIAEELEVCSRTVFRDIERLRREWLESTVVDFDQAVGDQLAKIDLIEQQAWAAWERSQTDKRVRTAETGGKGGDKTKLQEVGQCGDASYLNVITKCVEQRNKLLGLEAPQRQELSGPGGGPIRVGPEQISDDELLAIARRGETNIPGTGGVGALPPPQGKNGTPGVH